MRAWVLATVGFSLACAAGDGTSDTASTGGGACPAGAGLHEGDRRVYAYTDAWAEDNGVSGTWTLDVTEVRADGAWTTVRDGTYVVPDYDAYAVTVTSTGYCDADGVWLTEEYAETEATVDGETGEGWQRTTYDEPAELLPAGITTDGAAWTLSLVGTVTDSLGDEQAFEDAFDMEATDAGDVETPAGTFSALAIAQDGELARYVDASAGDVGDNVVYELLAY